jgi:uncharacterized repeat protein (TIGR02543 family)
VDLSTNISTVTNISFVYIPPPTVTATTNGHGSITPNLNGAVLTVNKSCKLTAKADPGYIFTGWTGSIVTNTAAISFKALGDMSFTANFIPNPYVPVATNYQGLFFDPANVGPDRAGLVTITPTISGSYSASLVLGGVAHSFSGGFPVSGYLSTNITINKTNKLLLAVQADMANGVAIVGTVGNGSWTVNLTAYPKGKPGVTRGNYTVLIDGSGDSSLMPAGDGCGSFVADALGNGKLTCTLADGTVITPSAGISTQGMWPMYASLYSGKGIILGWLTFTNDAAVDIEGGLYWQKQAQKGTFYSRGFTNQPQVSGSAYAPIKTRALSRTNDIVWFAEGNLPNSFTNSITINNTKAVSTNKALSMTFVSSTGLFSGSVPNPYGGKLKTISFKGAVLQKQGIGGGFFQGTNQVGRVVIQPIN